MISDPQEPIIPQQQTGNVQPFQPPQIQSPQQQNSMLQRSAPQWMQRQQLPPAQPPMYRPPPQMGGWGEQQMPQWAPPWLTGNWGGGGGMGGGGYGGGSSYGPYGPPQAMYQEPQRPMYNQMQPQMGGGGYNPNFQQRQFMQAPPYQAPNGNTGFMGPMVNNSSIAPQFSRQSYQPQPAGTVNAPAATPAPQVQQQQQQNRQAAVTPTPIFRNTQNDLA